MMGYVIAFIVGAAIALLAVAAIATKEMLDMKRSW